MLVRTAKEHFLLSRDHFAHQELYERRANLKEKRQDAVTLGRDRLFHALVELRDFVRTQPVSNPLSDRFEECFYQREVLTRVRSESDLVSYPSSILPALQPKMSLSNVKISSGLAQEILSQYKKASANKSFTWIGRSVHDKALTIVDIMPEGSKKGPTSFKGINVIRRYEYEINNENYIAEFRDQTSENFTDNGNETRYSEVIDKYRAQLMVKHRFLTVIHGSRVRSLKFGTDDHHFVPKFCIVLCPQVKGVVPIDEDTFPTQLDGIPVDIREGYFRKGMNPNPSKKGKRGKSFLKMGSAIGTESLGSSIGSLGGFVDLPHGVRTGFITCTHNLYAPHELLDKAKKRQRKRKLALGAAQRKEEERIVTDDKKHIGHVIEAAFNVDDSTETSVDACLVVLDEGIQYDAININGKDDFNLLEAGFNKDNMPKITTGRITEISSRLRHGCVFKTGATTGLTRSLLEVNGLDVKQNVFNFHTKETQQSLSQHYSMYRQLAVSNPLDKTGKRIFSRPGDSGAVVFLMDPMRNNESTAIGMIIGESDISSVVTPIKDVLLAVGLDSESGLKPGSTGVQVNPVHGEEKGLAKDLEASKNVSTYQVKRFIDEKEKQQLEDNKKLREMVDKLSISKHGPICEYPNTADSSDSYGEGAVGGIADTASPELLDDYDYALHAASTKTSSTE